MAARAAGAGSSIRCLKHWVSDNTIALLVEAPDEGSSLRAYGSDATEVARLFAPARRWLSYETINFPR